MKILRNRLFIFMITAMVFSGVGAIAATKINANQIYYTNSNNEEITVDSALNDLYTTQNTTVANLNQELTSYKNNFDIQYVYLTAASYSATRVGRALLSLAYYKDRYSKFKVTQKNEIEGYPISSCNVISYNSNNKVDDSISLNTEYLTAPHGDIKVDVKSQTDGSNGACRIRIMFYN